MNTVDAIKWIVIVAGLCALAWGVYRMVKPTRERRCGTCVFSTCSRVYPKLSCSVLLRDVNTHDVCKKWK